MMGWLGNIDPDDFYYAQHHTGGSSNAQKFSDPVVDRLLDAAREETDRARRHDEYARAATIIADKASYIYLYNPPRSFRRGRPAWPDMTPDATGP